MFKLTKFRKFLDDLMGIKRDPHNPRFGRIKTNVNRKPIPEHLADKYLTEEERKLPEYGDVYYHSETGVSYINANECYNTQSWRIKIAKMKELHQELEKVK